MLSKKMAFSLMRLIRILVVVFIALPAMAAEFDATFSVTNRVYAADIVVTLTFKSAVGLANAQKATINVRIVDKNGVETSIDITGDGTTPITTGFTHVTAKDINPNVPGVQTEGKVFQFTIGAVATDADDRRIYLYIPKGIPTVDLTNTDTSKAGALTIDLIAPMTPDPDAPKVISITRATVTSGFIEEVVTGAFQVKIVLSEAPKAFKAANLSVTGAEEVVDDDIVAGLPFTETPPLSEGGYSGSGDDAVPAATGEDGKYYPFLITITPDGSADEVVIKVAEFTNQDATFVTSTGAFVAAKVYKAPSDGQLDAEPNGRQRLTVRVKKADPAEAAGFRLNLPSSEGAQTEAAATAAETKATTDTTAPAAEVVKAEVPDTSVMIPQDGRIYISEIMFAGGGFLPQWIEMSNGSRTEQVNLSGWTLTVENATTDANVFVSKKARFRIPEGTKIDPSGQHDTPSTLLVVAKRGRTNLDGGMAAGQVVNLDITRPRYALLSDMAFKIVLAPPAHPIIPEQVAASATDVVGNLGNDGTAMWALPVNESGGRSSIIRRHISVEPKDGEMMDAWVLASETAPTQPMRLGAHSYYGFPTDVGTPGFRAGGAVPVELSHFHPERQKDTGAVVITWSTQSELNNAGFFIKRSQRRDGAFKAINATMVPGAGTTSEKRFYTYTDTTARPDVVYYYQIADVSLDGQRQTLTRGVRVKGHIGAAGKLTTTWGDLKTSNE